MPEDGENFTHLDFLYMIPRLHILVRLASLFSKGTDPKAQAMGYSHSYLDPENASIESLASFPNDGEIALATSEAWEEAVTLLGLLGICADDLSGSPATTPASKSPSLSNPDRADLANKNQDESETKTMAIQHLISVQQTAGWEAVDSPTKDRMHMLTCATIALEIEEQRAL